MFSNYFGTGKLSIGNRSNYFLLNAQSEMFRSWQAFESFKITFSETVEIKRLRNTLDWRSDNPELQMFEYNDRTIRIQKKCLVLVVIQPGDMTKE